MPRKRSHIFQKVSNLLKISLFLAKMKTPIIPKLIFSKKSSKLKKFELVKHYNYGHIIKEYQFSPSRSPLIHYHRKLFKKRKQRDIYSNFFLCKCLDRLGGKRGENGDYPLEVLPTIEDAEDGKLSELSDSGYEEDSVDERAERFIERFYEEIRMQRKKSLLQIRKS